MYCYFNMVDSSTNRNQGEGNLERAIPDKSSSSWRKSKIYIPHDVANVTVSHSQDLLYM